MSTFHSFPVFTAKHKKGTKRQTYGCYYLSLRVYEHFNRLINQYDDSVYLSIGTPLQSKKAMKEKLLEAEDIMQITGSLDEVKQVVESSQQQIVAVKSFKWYLAWNQTMLKDDYWGSLKKAMDTLFQEPPLDEQQRQQQQGLIKKKKAQVEALQRSWKSHAKFSHYTANALLFAAKRLEIIAFFLQKAQEELNFCFDYFPDESGRQYAEFLKKSLQQVQQEKSALAAAMSVRLQLMRKTGSLTNDDVTIHLITQLKTIKAIKPETMTTFKRPPTPFDSQAFNKMHHYVAHQGGTAKLQRTFNLQQSSKTIPLIGKQCATQYILLPANLSQHVPEKPSLLTFLFKGHQFRYEFFQDKTALLLKLSFLQDLKINTNSYRCPAEDTVWQQIKETENMIDGALQASEKQKIKGWDALFYRESNQLLEGWQTILYAYEQQVLQHQLTFFETWVSVPPVEHAYHQPHFSLAKIQEVSALLDQLENAIVLQAGQTEMRQRFISIKQEIETLFAKDAYYAQNPIVAADTLCKLSEGTVVNQEQFCQTLNYCIELRVEELQAFKQKYESQMKRMLCFVENTFKMPLNQFIISNDYLSSLLLMRQCGQLLCHLKSPTIQEKLANLVEAAITHYDKWMENNKNPFNKQLHDKIKPYHDLLEEFANTEQLTKLVAIQLKQRHKLNNNTPLSQHQSTSPTIIKQESVITKPDEKDQTRDFLTRQHQVFMQQREQHQQIMQKQQKLEQEMEANAAKIEKSLQMCEASQQTCQQLLVNNSTILSNFTTTQQNRTGTSPEITLEQSVEADTFEQTNMHTTTNRLESKRYNQN